MITLDRKLMTLVKRGFVSMPQGSDPSMGSGPVAGGGMLTQAQASPMGGTPQGGMPDPSMMQGGGMPMDPSMGGGGMPMDPSMGGGGMPMDPSMQGGAPMDPSMQGGAPAPIPADMAAMTPPGGSIIQLTPADFIMIIQAVQGGAGSAQKASKPKGAGVESKVDQILGMMGAPQQPAQAPAQGQQPQGQPQ